MHPLALILDMDGVLVDSNPVHVEAWYLYLLEYGITADGMMERMHGKRNDQLVRELFGSHLSEAEVIRHGAEKEALYRRLMKPQLAGRLVPGVTSFLERHRNRALGVGSNAEPANVDFVLDQANLRRFFQAVVNGHQVTHGKPHPEIFSKVAELLETPPSRCVVFEDSAAGIQAARAAGCHVVAVDTASAELPAADYSIRDFCAPGLDEWLQALG